MARQSLTSPTIALPVCSKKCYPTESKHVEIDFSENMHDMGTFDDPLYDDGEEDWEDF